MTITVAPSPGSLALTTRSMIAPGLSKDVTRGRVAGLHRGSRRDRDPSPALLRALYDATGGRPQEWRMLEGLDAATTDAIEFAVARGWVVVQAGHSICLTDAGQKLVGGVM